MLILSRRIGESIIINENITITVMGIMGSQVRFGVKAPQSIPVDREEIHERKMRGDPKPIQTRPQPPFSMSRPQRQIMRLKEPKDLEGLEAEDIDENFGNR